MPRPLKCRRIQFSPDFVYFKPAGVPSSLLEEIGLTLDELEALRLADYEGLYQAEAAEKMNVSRQTFGNIVSSARRKIADVLLNGKAMRIEGGCIKKYGSCKRMDSKRCGKPRCGEGTHQKSNL